MGDRVIIRQDQSQDRCTTGLAQPRELGVKVSQRAFEHAAVLRILCGLELLDDTGTRQQQSLAPLLAHPLIWRKARAGCRARSSRLGLLLFDGLALPTTGHG